MSGEPAVDGEQLAALAESVEQLHEKVDRVLAFCDLVARTAAPLMGGKGKIWMAMLAKTRGGGG